MRKGVLAALTALLAGHGLAFAQQDGSCAVGHPWGPTGPPEGMVGWPALPAATVAPPGDLPDKAPAPGDVDAQARPFGLWGSGEYLLWWLRSGRVPPLVTA